MFTFYFLPKSTSFAPQNTQIAPLRQGLHFWPLFWTAQPPCTSDTSWHVMNTKNTWPRVHKGQTAYHASCQSRPCTRPVLHSHLRLLMRRGSSCFSVNHYQNKQREEDDWICWVKKGKKGRYIRLTALINGKCSFFRSKPPKSQITVHCHVSRERRVFFVFNKKGN